MPGDPAYVGLDRTGRYLFTTYYHGARVAVHAIQEDGSIQEEPMQVVNTTENPHSMGTDPTNRYAYVCHTGGNAIFQFRFDAATGKLMPNNPPSISPDAGLGPRHQVFHPVNHFLYVSNEQGSSVSAYLENPETGILTLHQTISSVPPSYEGENTCAHIALHPNGNFVYVSNRGDNSIATFRVNVATGLLMLMGTVATGDTPRSFDLDSTGRFLIAAGEAADNITVYRIDPMTGMPEVLGTYPAGNRPFWVEIVG